MTETRIDMTEVVVNVSLPAHVNSSLVNILVETEAMSTAWRELHIVVFAGQRRGRIAAGR